MKLDIEFKMLEAIISRIQHRVSLFDLEFVIFIVVVNTKFR